MPEITVNVVVHIPHAAVYVVLRKLLAEPYGCPFCDCGVLRNPLKDHIDDCPYAMAHAVLEEYADE
jgi:hypothetical protein